MIFLAGGQRNDEREENGQFVRRRRERAKALIGLISLRDGSGSGSVQISASFGFSGFGLVFRPRFLSSGLGLVSGSVSGFGFHPWISNGYPK